jgi:hypothetical protein
MLIDFIIIAYLSFLLIIIYCINPFKKENKFFKSIVFYTKFIINLHRLD